MKSQDIDPFRNINQTNEKVEPDEETILLDRIGNMTDFRKILDDFRGIGISIPHHIELDEN